MRVSYSRAYVLGITLGLILATIHPAQAEPALNCSDEKLSYMYGGAKLSEVYVTAYRRMLEKLHKTEAEIDSKLDAAPDDLGLEKAIGLAVEYGKVMGAIEGLEFALTQAEAGRDVSIDALKECAAHIKRQSEDAELRHKNKMFKTKEFKF